MVWGRASQTWLDTFESVAKWFSEERLGDADR
ncbi:hypothetical protein C7964_103472 [Loktanella sp. PT4BL]|nr:hypothetical protein C7964_103472 [Loktanella sp. PT4BL]